MSRAARGDPLHVPRFRFADLLARTTASHFVHAAQVFAPFLEDAARPRKRLSSWPIAPRAETLVLRGHSSPSVQRLLPAAFAAPGYRVPAGQFSPSKTARLRRARQRQTVRPPCCIARLLRRSGSAAAAGRRSARCARELAVPNSNAETGCKSPGP